MGTERQLIYKDDARRAVLKENPSAVYCIDRVKAVDAVEVVRCKDCRFSMQDQPYDSMECMKWTVKWGVAYTTPYGFCHKGERRKEE